MKVAGSIATIASKNGMTGMAGVDHAVGAATPASGLKSFLTLTPADGIYYAKATNTLAITKPGVTFDGYDFSGVSINVTVDNVTFKNSHFDASVGLYAINGMPGTKNLTVDQSTFDGEKLDRISYSNFISSRGENTVITNNAFLNTPTDAVSIVGGRIDGNYFAGAGYATNAHSDAIWIAKTIGPVVITDNVIDWRSRPDAPTETNNPVRITGEAGNVSDVLVKNNIILGGSNTVLVSDGPSMTHSQAQVGTVTGVKIIDNVIDYGKYGDLERSHRPDDMVYEGNTHVGGAPVSPGAEVVGALPDLGALNRIVALAPTSVVYGTTKGEITGDYILGGTGNNTIYGSAAGDVIEGGAGRDYIRGGGGNDIFVYNSLKNSGTDLLTDFTQGGDRVYLAGLDGAPDAASDWQWLGTERFTGHEWQMRYSYAANTNVTSLEIDADGDLNTDFTLQFSGNIALKTSDFILVTKPGGVTTPTPTPTPTPVDPTPSDPAPTTTLKAPGAGGRVIGTAADENLIGSGNADDLRGSAGDDVLTGNGGKDFLYGGAGEDRFVFLKVSDSTVVSSKRDFIGDFVHGQDIVDLKAIDANVLTAGDQAFTWIGSAAFSGEAGELRFKASLHGGGGQVQGDVNGDGVAEFAIDIVTGQPMSSLDFWL